jgi:hypothetical protein
MSEFVFELTSDVTLAVFGTIRLATAFCEAHGAASVLEESEAADRGNAALYQAMGQAGRQIQQLYKSTGNLAAVGDTLHLHGVTTPNVSWVRVEGRRLETAPDSDYLLLSYFLD